MARNECNTGIDAKDCPLRILEAASTSIEMDEDWRIRRKGCDQSSQLLRSIMGEYQVRDLHASIVSLTGHQTLVSGETCLLITHSG